MSSTMRDDIVVDQSPIVSQYMPPKPATTGQVATSVPNLGGASSVDTSPNKLNRKQILLQQNFELKRKYESMVLEWIEILCDPVSEATLGEAVKFFDIDIKGKFRISLSERKVFDISVLKLYCSSTCLAASRWLEGQLTEEPFYLNNSDPASLKMTRVSIVPLDMDLAEFHASRTNVAPNQEPTEALPAFSLPSHGLQNVAGQALPTTSTTPAFNSALSSSSPSAGNAYVQSLLATVPTTPSFIKIVERDTSDVAPGEPLDLSDMSRDIQTVLGHDLESTEVQQYENVEGFRVPVAAKRQNKTVVSQKFHYNSDTSTLESRMAEVKLSDKNRS
ncbi:hypothetical protein CPC16_010088 [Podila verticillata]|nr:hypothetical protein CPC16_010088 [Podila verticillata]